MQICCAGSFHPVRITRYANNEELLIMCTTPLKMPLTAANTTRLPDLLCTDNAFRADL